MHPGWCHCSPQGPFPQFPGHLLRVTFCAATAVLGFSAHALSKASVSRVIFSLLWCGNGTRSKAKRLFPKVTHTATLVSTCYLQLPEGLWRMTVNSNETLGKKKTNKQTTPHSCNPLQGLPCYRVCPMPSPQKLMCSQQPLKRQLTHFTVFIPSTVGKTWLMNFLALSLKNQRSLTGQSLVWWLPESD